MFHPKPRSLSNYWKIIVPAVVLISLSSCIPTFIKKYPKNKPFVYKTNINLSGNLSKTEKSNLLSQLKVQLEDSIQAIAREKLLWKVIKKPPVFDTANAVKSIAFMRSLLHSSGYFNDSVWYDTSMVVDGDQYRTTVNFNVRPGPVTTLDSIWYTIHQAELQKLADSTKADSLKSRKVDTVTAGLNIPLQKLADSTQTESFLKKGTTFSQDTIAMDLDRLVELYRNNGYLRITRNELQGVWDTVDVNLLQPIGDPLEQLELLSRLAQRREHPTASLEIRLRPGFDSSKLIKYYVGKIYIYPDYGPDTANLKTVVLDSSYTVRYSQHLFKSKIFPQYISLRHGQVYNQNRYNRTLGRLNALVAWRLVNIEQRPRPGTDTVDFHIRLSAAKKYLFTANIEVSRNSNDFFAEGNLLGVGANVNLQNRNFGKGANQENLALRYGTELGVGSKQKFVNSRQATLGYNILVPRFVPHFKWLPQTLREAKSILAFNLSNTQRIDLYNLTTFNTYWGYEVQRRNKLYAVKFPNIEFSFLDTLSKLREIFQTNPGLRNLFTDGLVVSAVGSYTVNSGTKKNLNTLKVNLEKSGLINFIQTKWIQQNLYRFVKIDGEFKRLMKLKNNSEFVVRAFTGIGYPSGDNVRNHNLPFFKAYGAGGPNSMRGWGLRRLGPGHSLLYVQDFPDRFGDIQFEANAEYRFRLFQLYGFNFNTAFFTDMGNVWFLRKNASYPGGEFQFKNFLNDLAVDAGTGLRVDLGFFMVRLDYAFKLRNPTPEPVNAASQYKWFYGWRLKTLLGGTLQFGVTYPF
jgi:outer membrane protein insertion porin family